MRPLQCMGPDSLYYLGHGFLSTSADLGGEGGQRVYLSLFFSWFWISLSLFSIVFFCVSLSLVFGHFSPYKFVSLSLCLLCLWIMSMPKCSKIQAFYYEIHVCEPICEVFIPSLSYTKEIQINDLLFLIEKNDALIWIQKSWINSIKTLHSAGENANFYPTVRKFMG